MDPNSFKVDVIFNSVKELQNERSSLEQKLNSVRQKRRDLESENEHALAKFQQSSDINTKLEEMLKVAHHKVDQIQKQITNAEETIQQKRNAVESLNTQIEEERIRKEQSRKEFEKGCDKMAMQLLEAKQFYTNECLENELDKVETISQNFDGEDMMNGNQIVQLESLLGQIKLEESAKYRVHALPPQLQHLVLEILTYENEALTKTKQRIDEKRTILRNDLEQMPLWQPSHQQQEQVADD
ncbi:uncharacterized protein LOC141901265 [Tubulanus polymorphus]|uniref:uncharacterized protein LOC141901265 n=1 Tax=Tubulanus polymorphus TaxID=672921 RepID=UPI003DA29479